MGASTVDIKLNWKGLNQMNRSLMRDGEAPVTPEGLLGHEGFHALDYLTNPPATTNEKAAQYYEDCTCEK